MPGSVCPGICSAHPRLREADDRGVVPGFPRSKSGVIPHYASFFIQLKPAEVPARGRYSHPTQPR